MYIYIYIHIYIYIYTHTYIAPRALRRLGAPAGLTEGGWRKGSFLRPHAAKGFIQNWILKYPGFSLREYCVTRIKS